MIAAVAVPMIILVTWLILVLMRKGVPDRMLHWEIPGRVDGRQE